MSLPPKRPLAPAPARMPGMPAVKPGLGSALSRPSLNAPNIVALEAEEADLSSSSSSDDALIAPPHTTTNNNNNNTDLYAELEGSNEGEEVEVEEHFMDEDTLADRDEIIKNRIAAGQEQMKSILSNLDPQQLQRYETFRRVGFSRPIIKKIISKVFESLSPAKEKNILQNINPSTIIAISGIAKVFVGELIEEARLVQEEWDSNDSGPLMPSHIMEAQRRLKRKDSFVPKPTTIPRINRRFLS